MHPSLPDDEDRTENGAGADDEVFTHGVASFDPTDRRVILWTRAAGVDRVS